MTLALAWAAAAMYLSGVAGLPAIATLAATGVTTYAIAGGGRR